MRRDRSPRYHQGFTLLEMLAVIVLLGVIATIVVRQVGANVDKGKSGAGKAQLASLSMKIEGYALDIGAPPKELVELTSSPANVRLWSGPYAKPSDLLDPYGHSFGYRAPGAHGAFDLIFFGKDGQPGGDGYNADLGNWE
ncbi:type II secretion system protein GspG [Pseudomonas agarici]|uniref:Type II secretion system core protein G n=1 Tax=Pseudomonas agarici TaxID=46677 RepID=A0A0X1T1Y1_PSEAA|nr:type II secretion system major pseudopilin GspG [Pseudomonas agarici]AMB86065.1 type II secretion system protein GspG [Pseudomonas agarici]NWB92258.1 type II secretion system major pseudopilin GspG [Pseudomonas agarici]NWC07504.1 type II secretion system major pseudopilin GspG [Pseudomonas agarici]SEK42209.1 type II secretion system protein G (GspG) [Pseudomonas agarici]